MDSGKKLPQKKLVDKHCLKYLFDLFVGEVGTPDVSTEVRRLTELVRNGRMGRYGGVGVPGRLRGRAEGGNAGRTHPNDGSFIRYFVDYCFGAAPTRIVEPGDSY